MHRQKTRALAVALLCLFVALGACQPSNDNTRKIENKLQALVDSVASNKAIPGILLSVDAPRLRLNWQGASGYADISDSTRLSSGTPVRIASNTKTYVAVAVLRLWEDGKLSLNDSIEGYLTDEQAAPLAGDGYDLQTITLRHLLTHTSGMIDHAMTQDYFNEILANPKKRWTRQAQIQGAADWGDPLGPPGEAFSYSDTGYILLGQVIEKVTQKPLGKAVRDLVGFGGLGLNATWWEIEESRPDKAGERARQYIGTNDTYDWDASLDLYGGGGLLASVGDMSKFMRALFTNQVFAKESTLDTMLTTTIDTEKTAYRMGVAVRDYDGVKTYQHSGFWGTIALYAPELDLTVAAAVTQQEQGRAAFKLAKEVVGIFKDVSRER